MPVLNNKVRALNDTNDMFGPVYFFNALKKQTRVLKTHLKFVQDLHNLLLRLV